MALPQNTSVVLSAVGYMAETEFTCTDQGGVIAITEWNHADPQPTEQAINDYANDVTPLPNGQTFSQWQAENGGDPVLTRRRKAKEKVDLDDSVDVRALIELFNTRDNYNTSRIEELQQTLAAIKATSGGTSTVRNAIPSSWMPTATRPRPQAVQAYKDDIDAGNADT